MTFGKTLLAIGVVATVLKVSQISGFIKGVQSALDQIPESTEIKELKVKLPLGKHIKLTVWK